jgi:hypothetical protein
MKRVKVSLACLGLVLLVGVPAFAGPTYTLFADPPGGAGSTFRFGINDAGDYVGWYLNSGTYFGFMHDSSGFTPIQASHPTGINNSNDVVGFYQGSSGYSGFIDKSGVYTSLNYPGATSTVVYGTNDSDEVVGYYVDAGGVTHGFTEENGAFTTVNAPGAVATYVMGINDAGETVGSYFDGTDLHAFIDDGGVFTTIDYPGAPTTFAASINTAGDVVGWYTTCSSCPQIGFIRDASGVYTSIAPLAGIPTYLTGINNNNDVMVAIVGETDTTDFGIDLGLLLSGWGEVGPPPPVTPIPEPGTQVLMATGGILLLALGRLRRRRS